MLIGLLKKKDINKGILEYEGTNNAVLLDVRSKSEYQEGHIRGSENIEIEKTDAVISLIKDKTAPLFVYCYSGSRSNMAVNILRNMGYTNVKNIGGISSYTGTLESEVSQ